MVAEVARAGAEDDGTERLISHPSSGRVLCIGAGPLVRIMGTLEHAQYQVSKHPSAANDDRLLKLVATFIPDLILVNLPADDIRGVEILELLAFDPRTRNTPLIGVVPSEAPESWLIEAYGRSSCDFLRAHATAAEVLSRVHLLLRLSRGTPNASEGLPLAPVTERAANDDALAIAFRNPITGLCTREYLYHRISSEVTRARRYERSLSVLAIRCPLAETDALRNQVATTLRAVLRRPDVVAHIEAATWVAVLPEAKVVEIEGLTDRLRAELSSIGPSAFGRAGLDHQGGMGAHSPEELISAACAKCNATTPR